MIVPYAEALPAATVRRLAEFAEQGLAVRFVDGLPLRSSEGEDVSAELSELAGQRNVQIVLLDKLAQDLITDGHFDIRVSQYEPFLRNYHYSHDDLDVFMFFNEHPQQTIRTKLVLPVQGAVYAYDAFLNRLTRLDSDGGTGAKVVQLVLSPYESIVLLHGADLDGYTAALPQDATGSGIELAGEWTISLAKAEAYPRFQEWGKVTALPNMSGPDGLPRFTGTFCYETEFEWDESANGALLDLGEVYETAEVWLNGEYAGVRICLPYRLEINGLLKKGNNKLIIEVTNTLVKEQRDFLSSFAQQEPSGLIGPVRVWRAKE
ncbi:glycosylhydrolase-like jelly roll fold domain-containing protein [Paenibacillus oralis]|uniref:glycosylhydrolase-like jelly roll fold domain-containing protein n=1 Tax=Paenibacillus oralis TaxID=2490856 RepID=UPI001FE3773A|nr:glycosylhydrolase-like jelly roll fold domain-containing protein [Paenibacillus oralis]